MNETRILGVILAGGQSRRMGERDKLLVDLGDKPLLQHVIDRLGPQVDELILSAKGDMTRFAGFGLNVIADPDPQSVPEGPLAGLLAAFKYVEETDPDITHVAMAAGDTPFLPVDLVARFLDAAGAGESAIASSDGQQHWTCGLFPVASAIELQKVIDEDGRRAQTFAMRVWATPVEFDADLYDPFMNINTPQDLERAEFLLDSGDVRGTDTGKDEGETEV